MIVQCPEYDSEIINMLIQYIVLTYYKGYHTLLIHNAL